MSWSGLSRLRRARVWITETFSNYTPLLPVNREKRPGDEGNPVFY